MTKEALLTILAPECETASVPCTDAHHAVLATLTIHGRKGLGFMYGTFIKVRP